MGGRRGHITLTGCGLHEVNRGALRRFQEERGAEPTGELDDDTRAALEEDHGA